MTDAVDGICIERAAKSRRPSPAQLAEAPFSTIYSDHMLTAEYRDGAWSSADLRPYGALMLAPSVAALNYGNSVFEGLKAHRTERGDVAIFRPRDNARRLNRSATRLAMPAVPEALFVKSLRALVGIDREWVPPAGKGALYIRPVLFAIDESVRVKPAEHFLFVVFTFPFGFGSYYAEPVDLLVTEKYVRAFPGGTGNVKPAGNYAPAMLAEQEARASGFHSVLWLDGTERRYVEECGVMNPFFVIDDEVITPSLEGTILPGITRDSIIRIVRDMPFKVTERRLAIDELLSAHRRGALRECFGTGTAAIVTHIRRIRYRDDDIVLPPINETSIGVRARNRLLSITAGREPDPYDWLELV
jgi:branched-chain amino acid aminotransferase